METTVLVGKSIKSFGRDGHLRVHIEDSYKDDVANSRYLFVDVEGCLLPYFIQSYNRETSLLKFDEVHNPEDGRILSDTDLYLFEKDVKVVSPNAPDAKIIGYTLINQDNKVMGTVTDILEMPQHILFEVKTDSSLILVPFHVNILINIDEDTKTITLQVADGLEDI